MKLGSVITKINYMLFLMLFLFLAIDNFAREKVYNMVFITIGKNGILILAIIVFGIELIYLAKVNQKSSVFRNELISIIKLVIVFSIISLYYIQKNKGFVFETVIGMVKLILPIVVAYEILNIFNHKQLYNLMAIAMVIMLIGYLISIINLIDLDNIMSISFIHSYSPFESNFFSPSAMAFCLYFCYFRKNKLLTVLSVLFTIMTFKRIMVLYAIALLLGGGVVAKFKKMPKIIETIFVIGFFALSIFYIDLMQGKIDDFLYNMIGIDVRTFTMGRSYFMRNIISNFTSYGFMSSNVGYRSMEMDLPMIYVEMGAISVFATIYFYTKLVKQNWYNFLIISFCLLELLTSHWFDITYFWIVAYITIGSITTISSSQNSSKKKLLNVKFVWGKS